MTLPPESPPPESPPPESPPPESPQPPPAVAPNAGSAPVREQTRRRWAVVLAGVVVLGAVPLVVRARPASVTEIDPATLRARIAASAGQPFQGYAQSAGALGLPALPRLADVTALVSGATQLRIWYAGRQRWRVDELGVGTERGLYQTPDAQYVWDYGDNQITQIVGRQPVRLPRAADVSPPDLARRLLAAAASDRVTRQPARRVAGVPGAGLRIVPVDPNTTVAHVDIWADPRTGLPLQVEVTARGVDRPVFVTRFLEVSLDTPPSTVLLPPTPRRGIGSSVTDTADLIGALERRRRFVDLPTQLTGRARRDGLDGVSAVGLYGTGLAQFAVLPVPGRIGNELYDNAVPFGRKVELPGAEAVVVATGLLSVLIVRAEQTYVVAGLVDPALLDRVAADLAGSAS